MGGALVVTVFGSSRPHEGDADYEEARILGRCLAKHGFFVCSGGFGGGMEGGSPGGEEDGGEKTGGGAGIFKTPERKRRDEGEKGRGAAGEGRCEGDRRGGGVCGG